jgi:4,5-epoxidase
VGIAFPGVPLVERFLIADVRADLGRPRDAASVWLRGTEMLAAFPLPGQDLWRLMAPAPDGGPADLDPAAVLARMRARVAEEIGREVHAAQWTSSFRIHRRLAATYRRGRVLLAGDAAHIHSPIGGQGMNTGIGDAENLAWKLALVVTSRAGDGLLDSYQAERRRVAAGVLSATSRATNLLFSDGAFAQFLRDHLIVPLMDRPFVQRTIAERSSQLLVSYRGGPLARGRWRLSGLRPGDRVRDLPCHLTDRTLTRLHAELGGRWAVLAPARCAPMDVARAWLGDRVTELIADSREVLLVRPDGHLAWRGTEAAGLARWLAAALDRPVPARAPARAGMLEQ